MTPDKTSNQQARQLAANALRETWTVQRMANGHAEVEELANLVFSLIAQLEQAQKERVAAESGMAEMGALADANEQVADEERARADKFERLAGEYREALRLCEMGKTLAQAQEEFFAVRVGELNVAIAEALEWLRRSNNSQAAAIAEKGLRAALATTEGEAETERAEEGDDR